MSTRLGSLAKYAVREAVARFAPRYWRMRCGVLIVLMYHRVLPRVEALQPVVQPGMVVTEESFDMQLKLLREHFEPVALQEWLADTAAGRPVPRRACAVTFDDGWSDNYQYAYPILKAHKIPATIFVVTGQVGTTYRYWPERLAAVLWAGGAGIEASVVQREEFRWLHRLGIPFRIGGVPPTREQIDEIITRAKIYPDRELIERVAKMEVVAEFDGRKNPPDLLGWSQLEEMVASGLVEVGSHTRNHTRLSKVTDAGELRDEVIGSLDDILSSLGDRPCTFCYPNGDRSDDAEMLVRSRYVGACTVQRGWNTVNTDPFALKRIGIHEDVSGDRTRFLARLSGWI